MNRLASVIEKSVSPKKKSRDSRKRLLINTQEENLIGDEDLKDFIVKTSSQIRPSILRTNTVKLKEKEGRRVRKGSISSEAIISPRTENTQFKNHTHNLDMSKKMSDPWS